MSKFFNAPAVRASMVEIQELQEDIMTGIAVRGMRNPTTEEGHLYIAKMKKLLEKQKNFMCFITSRMCITMHFLCHWCTRV